LGQRFLLVHERKHGQRWYLPGGRVEPGESLTMAARRETLEEAGIPVIIEGILRVQHTPSPDGTRLRVIFVARPQDDSPIKTGPDEHTLGAAWMSLEEMRSYPLRGEEVLQIFEYVSRGAPVYPLELITTENAPYTGDPFKTQMLP
jgi:phosphatase NudJ